MLGLSWLPSKLPRPTVELLGDLDSNELTEVRCSNMAGSTVAGYSVLGAKALLMNFLMAFLLLFELETLDMFVTDSCFLKLAGELWLPPLSLSAWSLTRETSHMDLLRVDREPF